MSTDIPGANGCFARHRPLAAHDYRTPGKEKFGHTPWWRSAHAGGKTGKVKSHGKLSVIVVALTAVSLVDVVACSAGTDSSTSDEAVTAQPAAVPASCRTPENVPHPAVCFGIRRTDIAQPLTAGHPDATPAGYGPSDLRSAYEIPSGLTSSATVAIVDAYDNPGIESDLAVYRKQFGLPACTTANGCFRKVNQSGQASPLPKGNSGWAGEMALDVDMVSAVCPTCKILVVEATTTDMNDLGASVNTAVTLGAVAVSNSFGETEDSAVVEQSTSYWTHPGVFMTAAAGDNGYGAYFPASATHVTAVGGTTLKKSSGARGWSEVVWDTTSSVGTGTGSGCSAKFPQPAFQGSLNTDCSMRAMNDLSAVADPSTGVTIYDSYDGTDQAWQVWGGTSVATPIVAALFAYLGKATTATNAYAYENTKAFYDVTSGKDGSCDAGAKVLCTAGEGWDGPTGIGTPNAQAMSEATGPLDGGAADGAVPDAGKDAGKDSGVSSEAGAGTCAHPVCSPGAELTASCSACAADVCKADFFCCNGSWDNICVSEVAESCPSADHCN